MADVGETLDLEGRLVHLAHHRQADARAAGLFLKLLENLKDPDININLDEVMAELLVEGIDKFVQPFQSLMTSLETKVNQLSPV